jgi:hypothetical protein
LFLIYINDLGTIFKYFKPVLFADDSNLIIKGNSLPQLENLISQDIPALISWLKVNRLSLNLTKTHYMIFGSQKKKFPHSLTIEIDSTIINEVEQTKFLGVILENNLNWKKHIAYLSTKIAKSIGILYKAREMLNKKILSQLYYSFLYPYIMYCNIIWGNAPNTHLWQIYNYKKERLELYAI